MVIKKKLTKLRIHGFTLVELLVVISIIAMLLSILMPSLQKAREMAKSTVCKSQLKQFGIALQTYAEDNRNEYLVNEYPPAGQSPEGYYWFGRISAYIDTKSKTDKTTPLMRCPSGQSKKDFGNAHEFSWIATDYGLQLYSRDYSVLPGKIVAGKLDSIKRPSDFASFFDFYFGETKLYKGIPITDGSIYEYKWLYIVANNRNPEWKEKVFRHSDGINALYMDMHIAGIKNPDWWRNMTSPSSYNWENRIK